MITREEFMMNALGADADTLMEVLHELLSSVDMTFTGEEAVVLRAMMADPETKMHVATMLTDGAEKAGLFE
jgi:hypothetical protein